MCDIFYRYTSYSVDLLFLLLLLFCFIAQISNCQCLRNWGFSQKRSIQAKSLSQVHTAFTAFYNRYGTFFITFLLFAQFSKPTFSKFHIQNVSKSHSSITLAKGSPNKHFIAALHNDFFSITVHVTWGMFTSQFKMTPKPLRNVSERL